MHGYSYSWQYSCWLCSLPLHQWRDSDIRPGRHLEPCFLRFHAHASPAVEPCCTGCCSATQLKCAEGLPEQVTEASLEDDSFLQKFHHALLEVGRGSVREFFKGSDALHFQPHLQRHM